MAYCDDKAAYPLFKHPCESFFPTHIYAYVYFEIQIMHDCKNKDA